MKSSKNFPYQSSRRILRPEKLLEVYKTLRKAFGHQHWWPGETPFEIVVGAILTQNTAWTNVEKAIANLKRAGKLSLPAIHQMSHRELANLIRPAGYFNVKAKRLKNFMEFLFKEFEGSLRKMFRMKPDGLRPKLLSVNGIGPETADSILLYAGEKSIFVIDAYTKRIFSRHRLQVAGSQKSSCPEQELYSGEGPPAKAEGFEAVPVLARSARAGGRSEARSLDGFDYSVWQKTFTEALPRSVSLYNDFHAQIVHLGKHFCRSQKALCQSCPLGCYL